MPQNKLWSPEAETILVPLVSVRLWPDWTPGHTYRLDQVCGGCDLTDPTTFTAELRAVTNCHRTKCVVWRMCANRFYNFHCRIFVMEEFSISRPKYSKKTGLMQSIVINETHSTEPNATTPAQDLSTYKHKVKFSTNSNFPFLKCGQACQCNALVWVCDIKYRDGILAEE